MAKKAFDARSHDVKTPSQAFRQRGEILRRLMDLSKWLASRIFFSEAIARGRGNDGGGGEEAPLHQSDKAYYVIRSTKQASIAKQKPESRTYRQPHKRLIYMYMQWSYRSDQRKLRPLKVPSCSCRGGETSKVFAWDIEHLGGELRMKVRALKLRQILNVTYFS